MTSTELELTGRALTSWGSPGTRKGRKRSNCDPELRQVRGEYLTGWKGDADKNDEQQFYRTWMAKRIDYSGRETFHGVGNENWKGSFDEEEKMNLRDGWEENFRTKQLSRITIKSNIALGLSSF